MYCPYCGNRIPDDSSICEYCGNSLDGILEDNNKQKAKRKRETKKKTVKWLMVPGIVLFVVIIAIVSKTLLFTNEDKAIAQQEEQQQLYEKKENSDYQEDSLQKDKKTNIESKPVLEDYIIDQSLCYYRTQLNQEEQLIYDSMLDVAVSDNPSAPIKTISTETDPSSSMFDREFSRAYNALSTDHPELFWVYISDSGFIYTYSSIPSSNGEYQVTLLFPSPLPERIEMTEAMEAASDELLEGIDLLQPDQIIALEIHDKLIELVKYDDLVREQKDDMQNDLAHTAYGALVENSRGDENTAVCDGYSSAYEYLLKKAGIQCISISGIAGDNEETAESHTWNMTKIAEEWYETDCTWDDTDYTDDGDEILHEALSDSHYLDTLRHYLFQVTTERMNSFEPGEDYRYTSDNGWAEFLSSSVHIRNTEEDVNKTGDYMTPLAPIAEGTEFSFEKIR